MLAYPSKGFRACSRAFLQTKGSSCRRTLGESVRRAKDGFVPAALKCLPFWCTVHCVTFGVVAPRYRMAWASLCAVAWNAIISSENQEAIRRELALRELADSNFANGRENVERRAMRKLE